jgi:lysophospholipase L1-like esterase
MEILKYLVTQHLGKTEAMIFSTARVMLLVTWLCILMISTSSAVLFLEKTENQVAQTLPITVSCVGDSITEWSEYPTILQNMLGSTYEVSNYGVAGAAVSPSWYTSYVKQPEFHESKQCEPSIVVIMLGTNDAHTSQNASNFSSDYKNLVSEYQTLPSSPKILLVEPPPIYNNKLELNDTHLDGYVLPGIEQVAYDLGLLTIDVNAALANHPEFFEDGVHPNSEGALAIATEIVQNMGLEN